MAATFYQPAFAALTRWYASVGADNPVTYAELWLQGHDVITSEVFTSPSTHAWGS
jgi:hypothetical protein